MANQNGSNAYKLRYDDNAAEKRIKKSPVSQEPQKHIKPNMTVKLNKKRETRASLATRPLAKSFKSFDTAQLRVIFAVGFAFSIAAGFLAFIISCEVRSNELDHRIKDDTKILNGLEDDYSNLLLNRDRFMSDAAIKEYAENNLGMQQRDNHQVNWFFVGWENDFDD